MGCRGPSDPLEPENDPKLIHGFTPFFLAYRAEAVLPSDLDHGAPRVKAFDRDRATEAQQDAVDLLEEAHETTVIRFTHYQHTLHRNHESKLEEVSLRSETSCFKGPS